jgi:hypothetical protein
LASAISSSESDSEDEDSEEEEESESSFLAAFSSFLAGLLAAGCFEDSLAVE